MWGASQLAYNPSEHFTAKTERCKGGKCANRTGDDRDSLLLFTALTVRAMLQELGQLHRLRHPTLRLFFFVLLVLLVFFVLGLVLLFLFVLLFVLLLRLGKGRGGVQQ